MSLSRNIHLEPFIKIPIQYEEYSAPIQTCGTHENHKGDKFCPICGKEVKAQITTLKQQLWCEELIGNENFSHYIEGDFMYLFSNTKSETEIDTDENVFTVLTNRLISHMLDEFSEKHANDILLLKNKINDEIVVQFGFVYTVD